MRFSLALLAALSFVLSACANMSPGLRPNGWARPVGEDVRVTDRAEAPPVRTASVERSSERNGERTAPAAHPPVSASSGMMIPVVGIEPGDLSDSFNSPRSGGRTHRSIDISAPLGTPLVAVVDGIITRKHWNRLGGRTLYLSSANGRYDYYYAHMDAYEDGIEIGAEVSQGDVLGTVGSTGNARGPHLHFQVLDKNGSGRGTPVNPYNLLRSADLADAR
ncbi:MAG: M23 family metallopeptidase [Bacteroidetes bacterium]|nr:M23 family metallopeptidase [Bacteroidota bacterium]